MAELTREEFLKQKEAAARQMKELYGERGVPSFPSFVALPRVDEGAENAGENITKDMPKTEKHNASCPKNACSHQRQNCSSASPLGILSSLNLKGLSENGETLLILGLIFLLLGDNADEKLILALIFIML